MTAFDDLAAERRWVLWRWVERPQGPTKVPYQPSGVPASSTDPSTWYTLAELEHAKGYNGVGFVLTGDGIGGIDLDHCRNPETGAIDPWARDIIQSFASYAEVSPSGTGIKILAAGAPSSLPGSKWYPKDIAAKPEGVPHADVFVDRRFFTVTRRMLDWVPDEIVDCGDLDGAWDRLVYQIGHNQRPTQRIEVEPTEARSFDEQLLGLMLANSRVRARWERGTDGGKDRSSNDAALAVAMASAGFSHADIGAALREYPLGQIGSGKLQGPDAERQIQRLLEVSEGHRPVTNEAHPDELSNLVYAVGEGLAMAQRIQRVQDRTERDAERRTPLLTRSEMSILELIETEPPEREWIIENVLPLGVVGTLSAAGGTGKSWAMIMLSVCMSMGIDFWGLGTPRPGGILILSAEDDRSEFHRRLRAVLAHIMETTGVMPDGLADRLAFADRVGDRNLLTAVQDGQISRTDLADRIVATANQVPDCKLIIADPLSRFRGGSANGEEEATRFVEALEYIRKETGATVLVPSHTGKDAGRTRDGSQHAVRGSSALVDGMRWVGTLMTMSLDEAKERGIAEDDAKRWVRLEIPKNNYAPPFDHVWLHKMPSGIMVREDPADISPILDKAPKAEREYERVLDLITHYIGKQTEQGQPVRLSDLKNMGGQSGILKIGVNAVSGIVNRAIAEGKLDRVRDVDNSKLFQILLPTHGAR
jgi:RecA-family ATPase